LAERVLVTKVGDTSIYADDATGRCETTIGHQKLTRGSPAALERE
jgi:hypothetical protein